MLAVGSKNADLAGKPTIRLDVPLKTPNEGIVIDFMRMAEEKYGFDMVHPEVKAAALDLVGDDEDNDEMEEEEVDLGAENGATPGAGTSATKKPKNRGKIEGKYDLNDPFIDDSEMLWEEQAASTKDGFFVYSGALFSKGEAPQIERADGSIKKVNAVTATATGASTPGTKTKQTRKKKTAASENADAPPKKKAKKKADKDKEKAEKAEKADKTDKTDKEKGDKADKHEKAEKADKAKAETSSATNT